MRRTLRRAAQILMAGVAVGGLSSPALAQPRPTTTVVTKVAAPTPAQNQAWPAIHAGDDVLISAPTGSGKTLAAFLAAIDSLVRQGLASALTHTRTSSPIACCHHTVDAAATGCSAEAPLSAGDLKSARGQSGER